MVRHRYVPVLLDVYDRLALEQEAPEQALYGHIYRLALANERCALKPSSPQNWIMVARAFEGRGDRAKGARARAKAASLAGT